MRLGVRAHCIPTVATYPDQPGPEPGQKGQRAATYLLAIYSVVAQDVVELCLGVPTALREPSQHQQAGQAELAAAELPDAGAVHADRPGRRLATRQLVTGLRVNDMRGRGQDRPGTEARACP